MVAVVIVMVVMVVVAVTIVIIPMLMMIVMLAVVIMAIGVIARGCQIIVDRELNVVVHTNMKGSLFLGQETTLVVGSVHLSALINRQSWWCSSLDFLQKTTR